MRIIREPSYLAPEGDLSGTVTSGRLIKEEKNGRDRESVRLTISVDPIPSHPMHDFKVRADYWETQANEFIRDAKKLLDAEADQLVNKEGEIVAENLALLEGKRVRFTVVHDRKPGHQEAYRKVLNLRPEKKAA